MTVEKTLTKARSINISYPSFCCIIICFFMLYRSYELKQGVIEGLNQSFQIIIPTIFPFLILSDLWTAYFTVSNDSLVSRMFKKIFHISPNGIIAFLCGAICGFPLGVKIARSIYERDEISADQLTFLSGFCNNPSLAFIVSGVGLGLFGSTGVGIRLYLCCMASAIFCGILFRSDDQKSNNLPYKPRQSFDLVVSIKNAGMSSIIISSYIVFFSAVFSSVKSMINSQILSALISSLLEISTASKYILHASDISFILKKLFIGFAIGFSGLSVHLQAFSILPKECSRARYLVMKATQGLICSILSLITI